MPLYYQDTGGTGRPVVLIHGWPLSSAAWSKQIPALSEAGYRVIAYDRRGFGRSDKPATGYDYDTLTQDLDRLMTDLDLRDATLVGFSMAGGEVARYVATHGAERLHSVVFASAVPPYLKKSDDNPEGPLDDATADEFETNLTADRQAFFEQFTKDFFTAGDTLKVTEDERKEALDLCLQSSPEAALGCMQAWATTDFRDDLIKIEIPALVLHGLADGIVPFEGSGQRTHRMVTHAELVTIPDAPHGCNTSHPDAFNTALLDFLKD